MITTYKVIAVDNSGTLHNQTGELTNINDAVEVYNTIEPDETFSTIEICKLVDGEITEFYKGEVPGLTGWAQPRGWIAKQLTTVKV